MWSIKKQVGFTLIEILVVTTIISILSAILYANFTSARQDARNKIMRTTLSEIQLALEVYRAQNGFYPLPATTPAACYGAAPGLYTGINSASCPTHRSYISGLVPDFIASIPTAAELSRNSTCQIQYRVNDNISPTAYKLTLVRCVEGVSDATDGIQQSDEFARCPSACAATGVCDPTTNFFYESLATYSNGGQCY